MVAGAALTAALALGALPGIAGSAGPTPASVVDPSAFQSVQVPAFTATDLAVAPLDNAFRGSGPIDSTTRLIEPGKEPKRVVSGRPTVAVPAPGGGSALKPPRYRRLAARCLVARPAAVSVSARRGTARNSPSG